MRAEVENLPLGSNCKIPNFRPKRIPNRPNLEKRRSKSEKKNFKKHYKMPVKRKKKNFKFSPLIKFFGGWKWKPVCCHFSILSVHGNSSFGSEPERKPEPVPEYDPLLRNKASARREARASASEIKRNVLRGGRDPTIGARSEWADSRSVELPMVRSLPVSLIEWYPPNGFLKEESDWKSESGGGFYL